MTFRKLATALCALLLFFFSATQAFAANEFLVNAQVEYRFDENGQAQVTHHITLENLFSNLYATNYTLTLENVTAEDVAAFEDGNPLQVDITKVGQEDKIKVSFANGVVGKGEKRTFEIKFTVSNFSTKTGQVWEISIPKLGDATAFTNYSATVIVPNSFGDLAYVSPNYASKVSEGSSSVLVFTKESILDFGISAGFGNFQVFSYQLNYHLENPLGKTQEINIPVPPDTAFQKVFIESIDPTPTRLEADADGNWLAFYELKGRERVDIKVLGSVQIFSTPTRTTVLSVDQRASYLTESPFWQVNDEKIKLIANNLKSPRAIYDWVVNNLSYDYDRVRPNVKRLGAIASLASPQTAICTEFTDVFIALSRTNGIPAREINGFAYTENPDIQPLSLVADVLHAWPEYYDDQKQSWIPVDPTWGNTTGGIDYFTKLDLRHFTFVIHGLDSEEPFPPGSYKLGPNPQKDVFVSFGKLPEKKTPTIAMDVQTLSGISVSGTRVKVNVKNLGPVAAYDIVPQVYFDDTKQNLAKIAQLLPFSETTFEFVVPVSFLGLKTPTNVTVEILGEKTEIQGFKTKVLTNSIILISTILILFVLLVLFLINRHKVGSWLKKFRSKQTSI